MNGFIAHQLTDLFQDESPVITKRLMEAVGRLQEQLPWHSLQQLNAFLTYNKEASPYFGTWANIFYDDVLHDRYMRILIRTRDYDDGKEPYNFLARVLITTKLTHITVTAPTEHWLEVSWYHDQPGELLVHTDKDLGTEYWGDELITQQQRISLIETILSGMPKSA